MEGNLFLGDTFKEEGSLPLAPSFPPQLSGLQSLRYLNLNSCGLMASAVGELLCLLQTLCPPFLLGEGVAVPCSCGPVCNLCQAEMIRCFLRDPALLRPTGVIRGVAAARVMSRAAVHLQVVSSMTALETLDLENNELGLMEHFEGEHGPRPAVPHAAAVPQTWRKTS